MPGWDGLDGWDWDDEQRQLDGWTQEWYEL
jgi:hypothetical protein